jgi:hypothetical protein
MVQLYHSAFPLYLLLFTQAETGSRSYDDINVEFAKMIVVEGVVMVLIKPVS